MTAPRSALVFGGTGMVGGAVLRELARRDVRATFSYGTNEAAARTLASELGHDAFAVDLADSASLHAALDARPTPDVVIYCAGVTGAQPLAELADDTWQRAMAVNVRAPMQVARWLAARHEQDRETKTRDVVIAGGLDRAQSLPLPVCWAATQGAVSAMVMALGHELGPLGIRINMVALGVLEGGTSRDLASQRRRDYVTFSALRRIGTADEAAKLIAWLALENTYIQGKVVAANGGI